MKHNYLGCDVDLLAFIVVCREQGESWRSLSWPGSVGLWKKRVKLFQQDVISGVKSAVRAYNRFYEQVKG